MGHYRRCNFTLHYLAFEDVFRALDLYYSFGAWKWNFDKNSVVYLLLLGLTGYILIQSKTTKLGRRNIRIFERLFTRLLLTKQYDELAQLLDQHIKTVFEIADKRSIRYRVAKSIRPMSPIDIYFRTNTNDEIEDGWFKRILRRPLNALADKLEANGKPEEAAREIVGKLLTSPHLTAYLAVSYPYMCLEFLKEPLVRGDEFLDLFIQALMEDETSIFYSELKNNHNSFGHHRLRLPPENKLLNFFFKDVNVAANFGIYRSVGEATCQIIEYDQKLIIAYNGPLGYYDEASKYKCPIFCGIHFFRNHDL